MVSKQLTQPSKHNLSLEK